MRHDARKRNPTRIFKSKRGRERRNGTRPPADLRVIGTLPSGAMARLRAARINAINHPGRNGAGFVDEAVHIERNIAQSIGFRARP